MLFNMAAAPADDGIDGAGGTLSLAETSVERSCLTNGGGGPCPTSSAPSPATVFFFRFTFFAELFMLLGDVTIPLGGASKLGFESTGTGTVFPLTVFKPVDNDPGPVPISAKVWAALV